MSLFASIAAFFRRLGSGQTKKDQEWAKRYDGKPAQPSNLTPLDPDAPWNT